jgi:hypothetical protein
VGWADEAVAGERALHTACGLAGSLEQYERITDRSFSGVQLQLYRRRT